MRTRTRVHFICPYFEDRHHSQSLLDLSFNLSSYRLVKVG
jgi:hypothetical protein